MTSILSKMSKLNKAINTTTRVEMTDLQVKQCKEALTRDNRGYNVQPNRFDLNTPYRVAINYQNNWHNYGNFTSADVAAAIGSIVAVAFFGEKAVAGEFDEAVVDGHVEFTTWLADARNADVIAKANGEQPSVHDGGILAEAEATVNGGDVNPF